MTAVGWGTYFPQCFSPSMGQKKTFNVFSDKIWTGELNYSPFCAAPSDDNIVPSRPETQNTKIYFCRVGNCQRNTPLSCLCMHKEHQRLVSDHQMDDLNVTLARPQRQSSKETPRIVRGAASCAATPNFSLFHSLALSLCLSFYRGFVSLILLSHSSVLSLPPSCLSFFLSITLSLSHTHTASLLPSLPLAWSPLMVERPVLLLLLMRNGKQSLLRTLTGTLTQIRKPRG